MRYSHAKSSVWYQQKMNAPADHAERLRYAERSLLGLSIGDAFGDRFFHRTAEQWIELKAIPRGPWPVTDDTVMAISIVDVLAQKEFIDQELLAKQFGARYWLDRERGYGATAHGILARIGKGEPWRDVSYGAFDGAGSMGNGGAMRSAPIGAYFFDDYARTAAAARESAEVTHAHAEGQAGAIAVAIAAAWVARGGTRPDEMFATVLAHTPGGFTHEYIYKASKLPLTYDVRTAVSALGNGTQVVSYDTVPFALWCAARHLGHYEDALWATVSGLGDRDTTCAIVGGIVASDFNACIPHEWETLRESLGCMSLAGMKERS